MTCSAAPQNLESGLSRDDILSQVEAILSSAPFSPSKRCHRQLPVSCRHQPRTALSAYGLMLQVQTAVARNGVFGKELIQLHGEILNDALKRGLIAAVRCLTRIFL